MKLLNLVCRELQQIAVHNGKRKLNTDKTASNILPSATLDKCEISILVSFKIILCYTMFLDPYFTQFINLSY